MQIIVLVISLVLMAVVAYFFIDAVRASGGAAADDGVDSRRGRLVIGLLIAGAIITIASLMPWPHSITSDSADIVTVNATGSQWSWDIDVEQVPAGRTVVFNVHAADVNHGLGVYGPDRQLLFQTQGMPGYVNRVEYVFETPGRYRVLCLEFCGLAHHEMMSEFDVVAADAGDRR